jgi:hypothetical protein
MTCGIWQGKVIGISAKRKSAQLQSVKVVGAGITQKVLDKLKQRWIRVSHCPTWKHAVPLLG